MKQYLREEIIIQQILMRKRISRLAGRHLSGIGFTYKRDGCLAVVNRVICQWYEKVILSFGRDARALGMADFGIMGALHELAHM